MPRDTTGTPLAQLVVGEDIACSGSATADDEPWRVPIGDTSGRSRRDPTPAETKATGQRRTSRARRAARRCRARGDRAWREPLAAFGCRLQRAMSRQRGAGRCRRHRARRARASARRCRPARPARADRAVRAVPRRRAGALDRAARAGARSDWTEALGQGDLGALALLAGAAARSRLRSAVTDFLDGVAPRAVRLVGGAAGAAPRRLPAHARRPSDAAIESELATQLGRIAVVEGSDSRAGCSRPACTAPPLLATRRRGTAAAVAARCRPRRRGRCRRPVVGRRVARYSFMIEADFFDDFSNSVFATSPHRASDTCPCARGRTACPRRRPR